jgi:ABC-type protease/lipase transport system fused ATPase/permease subunit
MLRLLCGIWKPTSGTVRLDGADVYSWERADFGTHVAYQPQDTELFAGTIRNNICRFATDANDADIVKAAQAAGAHDLVLRLSKGYETELGEAGTTLSAGQRQRVGLARTLYGNPKVIILDEPNANLDAEGEAALLKALEGAKAQGATIVMVSHKPSMFATADKMLVLRNGMITQYGPRDEVLRSLQGGPRPALQEVKS